MAVLKSVNKVDQHISHNNPFIPYFEPSSVGFHLGKYLIFANYSDLNLNTY